MRTKLYNFSLIW